MDRRHFTAGGLLSLAAPGARANVGDYPNRPITLIVPFGPGSGADAVSRVLAQHLGEALGTRVIVDNKAGASGAIGATAAARSDPDGYTLVLTSNTTHSANPTLLRSISYDPIRDFAPIVRVGNFVYVLIAGPSAPAKDVRELVAYAKAHPGKLSYAYGNGTGIVCAEAFKSLTGTDILRVPYKSTPPAMTDMIAGRVSMMFVDLTASKSNIEAGSLRALTVSTPVRSVITPNVPSMLESGVPGFDITAWAAIFAPARTPVPIVTKLNAALRRIIDDPEVRKRLGIMGFEAFSSTPDELGRFVVDELVKWTALIKSAGIQAE